jgi:Helix-turn-helix domain
MRHFVILDIAVELQHNLKETKMKYFNPETKTYKLFNALYNGEAVTASQAEKRFGIKNISAEVSRIRQNGYAVYANTRLAGNNVKVTEYVIGQPSRKIVAAGYKALAMGIVA